MTPFELTALVTVLANVLAEEMDNDELAFVSAVFEQLGDTLATIALQRAKNDSKNKEELI